MTVIDQDLKIPRQKPRAPASDPVSHAADMVAQDAIDMVRLAVTNQEVVLAFQPIVRSSNPNSIAFYESLLRVLDASGRIIPAKDFLPFITHSTLARDLDVLALRLALRQLLNHPNLCLSINMSARAIGYLPWLKTFTYALDKHPRLSNRLTLEISETSLLEVPDLVSDFMTAHQPKGVAFAIDHFGADHSSFSLLRDLCFDMVKLDGTLTKGLSQDKGTHAITDSIAALAKNLDMQSVATQVETLADAQALAQLKIPYLQGFAFQAPSLTPPWRDQGA